MGIVTVFLTALALSMDAFSVALSKGLAAKKANTIDAIKIALCFGGFQAAMPFIGWLFGSRFAFFIEDYTGYVGFALLTFIGAKMLFEALRHKDGESADSTVGWRSLCILGIATSIDALAVGLTFSLTMIDISYIFTVLLYCLIIGIVTFILSASAYLLGTKGSFLGNKGELAGGIVLILIGIKMLVEQIL